MFNTACSRSNSNKSIMLVRDVSNKIRRCFDDFFEIIHKTQLIKFTGLVSDKAMRDSLYKKKRQFFKITNKDGAVIENIVVGSDKLKLFTGNRIETGRNILPS